MVATATAVDTNESGVEWRPAVTIVMRTRERLPLLRQCLVALAANTPGDLYELVLIDGGSTDGTRDLLAVLDGDVQPVLNDGDVGLAGALTIAAERGAGEYLVLLGEDTIPQPGWLEALLLAARTHPGAGAIGARQLSPDGRLWETGGALWRDSSPAYPGRGSRADDPRWMFVRDADFCTAGALLVQRAAWQAISDRTELHDEIALCAALRDAGWPALVQPAAEVVSYAGAAGPPANPTPLLPPRSGEGELNGGPVAPANEHARRIAERRLSLTHRDKTVLVIDHRPPEFDRRSDAHKMWEWITILCGAGHHVVYIARNGEGCERYVEAARTLGVEIYPWDPDALDAIGHPHPAVPSLSLPEMCGELQIDVVWLSYWYIAGQYLAELRRLCPSATFVIDSHDAAFLREQRRAALEGTPEARARAERIKSLEPPVYAAVDRVLTVTEEDRQALLPLLPPATEVLVVPNVHPVEPHVQGYDARDGLLFVGNATYFANEDAVRWFASEVFPRVRAALPDVTLTIAGNEAERVLADLAETPGIDLVGWVPEIAPYLRRARLSIAPLRYGAGLKGKVGEALAAGLPVITTPIGAEGFGLDGVPHGTPAKGMIVAPDPEGLARAIVTAYADRETWEGLAAGACASVAHLSPEALAPLVLRALADSDRPSRARRPLVDVVRVAGQTPPPTPPRGGEGSDTSFAECCNAALAEAMGDWVALVRGDMELPNSLLNELGLLHLDDLLAGLVLPTSCDEVLAWMVISRRALLKIGVLNSEAGDAAQVFADYTERVHRAGLSTYTVQPDGSDAPTNAETVRHLAPLGSSNASGSRLRLFGEGLGWGLPSGIPSPQTFIPLPPSAAESRARALPLISVWWN